MNAEKPTLAPADRSRMTVAMDRLIPPVESMLGAGSLGLVDKVEELAGDHERYGHAIAHFLHELAANLSSDHEDGLSALNEGQQDELLQKIEASIPTQFSIMLEVVYLAYYSDPRVHTRIGWRTGPLQPHGFDLPPFDESILDSIRTRQPFWRTAPE